MRRRIHAPVNEVSSKLYSLNADSHLVANLPLIKKADESALDWGKENKGPFNFISQSLDYEEKKGPDKKEEG